MNCSFCQRQGRGRQLPRGWKVHGGAVFCLPCRRERYRLRSITMSVVEPAGSSVVWQNLREMLVESWNQTRDGEWEARIANGQAVVRLLISGRWWNLRLKSAAWTGGQKAAYEKIASGEAAGELLFIVRQRMTRKPGNNTESCAGSLHGCPASSRMRTGSKAQCQFVPVDLQLANCCNSTCRTAYGFAVSPIL